MDQEPSLEERLSENNSPTAANPGLVGKIAYHSKYFVADGISNALFSSIMVITERVSGMEWDKIGTSRSIGAVTAFLTGYAYNSLLRKQLAKSAGVNTQSSWLKKKFIDITVGMATMAPYYAPILYYAGASSKEMAIALVTGSLLGAVAGGVYGSVADKWRVYCGLQPVLNK